MDLNRFLAPSDAMDSNHLLFRFAGPRHVLVSGNGLIPVGADFGDYHESNENGIRKKEIPSPAQVHQGVMLEGSQMIPAINTDEFIRIKPGVTDDLDRPSLLMTGRAQLRHEIFSRQAFPSPIHDN